jgi:hypothetical protein
MRALCRKRCHLQSDALFLVNVYSDLKFCPSLIETDGIRIPIQNFRHLPLFTVGPHVRLVSLLDVHHRKHSLQSN